MNNLDTEKKNQTPGKKRKLLKLSPANTGCARDLEFQTYSRLLLSPLEDYRQEITRRFGERNFRLTNGVITSYLNSKIDITELAIRMKKVGFNNANKGKFSGLIYKFLVSSQNENRATIKLKFTALIFRTGSIVIVGAKSIQPAILHIYQEHVMKILELLGLQGLHIGLTSLSNLTFAYVLPTGLDFKKLAGGPDALKIDYTPEFFPAAFIRPLNKSRIVSLLYTSGKSILTGCKKNTQEILPAMQKIFQIINNSGALPHLILPGYQEAQPDMISPSQYMTDEIRSAAVSSVSLSIPQDSHKTEYSAENNVSISNDK
jgi:TATA-box binding protein (TBP) (component of TFIID and TFIIIB)